MKNIIKRLGILILILHSNQGNSLEKKIDQNGNEYFISEPRELRVVGSDGALPKSFGTSNVQKVADLELLILTTNLKSGCLVPEKPTKRTAAVLPLDDGLFVVPIKTGGLPPHPQEAGKVTIAGIDSDNDCVRDDIEHYIAELLPNADQVSLRLLMLEYSLWLGISLSDNLSQDAARTSSARTDHLHSCLASRVSDSWARRQINELFAHFHNTWPRTDRYLENSSLVSGWSYEPDPTLTCSIQN